MTTPGGVPNLPQGALTLDNISSDLEDMSGDAMKTRAVSRFSSIFNLSTGLDPALDITPFGILTRIWAEANSVIANADPADIQGPDDIPDLLLEFITGLPVVGQFVELFEAILGTYEGDDETLLGIQALFAPIRALLSLIPGLFGGSIEDLSALDPAEIWSTVITTLLNPLQLIEDTGIRDLVQSLIDALIEVISGIPVVGGTLVQLLEQFTDWFDDTQATAAQASDAAVDAGEAKSGLDGLASLFGLTDHTDFLGTLDIEAILSNFITGQLNPLGLLESLDVGLRSFVQELVDAIVSIIRGVPFVGGTLADSLDAMVDDMDDWRGETGAIVEDIQNGWEGTGTGNTGVFDTVGQIREAIAGGYTLQTFTSSNSSWSVPAGLANAVEAYAGAINGGGKGNPGVAATGSAFPELGGSGGSSGGYKVEKFDPATLGSTLNVTVGAAATTNGAHGGTTSIVNGATTLVSATPDSSGIATVLGYQPSTSAPGAGGAGGDITNSSTGTAGAAGVSSASSTGGAGGAESVGSGVRVGGAGSAGGAGQTTGAPISGGGGGGGGGAARSTSAFDAATGGAGGNGGFPGGGSGGGGSAYSTSSGTRTGGAAGTPGNGFAFLIWK